MVQWLRLCFKCRGHEFNPWSGNYVLTCLTTWPNIKKTKAITPTPWGKALQASGTIRQTHWEGMHSWSRRKCGEMAVTLRMQSFVLSCFVLRSSHSPEGKRADSGVSLPRFKFCLCHLVAVWPWISTYQLFTSVFYGNENQTYFIGQFVRI